MIRRAHPTAEWPAQQLREAFPFDQVPRNLLRDRDQIFGDTFRAQVTDMQIQEVLSAPRSPCSIRRECLDYAIVFGAASLRRTLSSFLGQGRAGASADPATGAGTSGSRFAVLVLTVAVAIGWQVLGYRR